MTTAATVDIGRLRSRLSAADRDAERAFERAFDLQQAGAPAHRVEAAMAEIERLQESARELRAQLDGEVTLH